MIRAFTAVLLGLLMSGCVTHQRSFFVGDYYSAQPCSLGSDLDLSLRADGSYRMIRTLPAGVGPEMAAGTRAGFEEVGRWSFDGVAVVLRSTVGKSMKLTPDYQSGVLVLADAEIFGLRLEKQKPNQPPEPTVMSVTPRADARVAPATTVAHL